MSAHPKKFYLTTPIYYVNARPHIGHAYTTIVADVLARRHRLLGDDTFFLTGTDEHGQKIERSAAAAGIPPQQFADQVSKSFEDLWKRMGITNDRYIRTTDPKHKKGVQKLFAELYERGFIYLDSYTGAYCVPDETFVDVPAGDPCPDCGRPTETVTEENFFFKLSAFQHQLLNLIHNNVLKIEPQSRRNEVMSFLTGDFSQVIVEYQTLVDTNPDFNGRSISALARGYETGKIGKVDNSDPAIDEPHYYAVGALKDLSVSRSSFTWGIPVPEPAASAAKQPHVIYVWLDALANYMTAIGYGSDYPADQAEFEKFWPADLHLVGKEIIRFHCVYWPAFLLAAGLPLPKAITAHGWLLFDNSKMSKSKGNIVRTETILDAFGTLCPPVHAANASAGEQEALVKGTTSVVPPQAPTESALAAEVRPPTPHDRDLFAADVLRYFLLREIPFGQDGSFSFDALITRYNADLANGYGNLVSRTLSMIGKYFDETLPEIASPDPTVLERRALFSVAASFRDVDLIVSRLIANQSFLQALSFIQSVVTTVDQYISSSAPWKIAASAPESPQLRDILYTAAESIRIITALLYPILPYATANVWRQLGLGDIEAAAANGKLTNLQWGGLKPGTKLGPLSPIFPRADKSLAETMITMEEQNQAPKPDTQRPDAPLKSATTPAHAAPVAASSTDPAAPPRAFDEANAAAHVGGSSSETANLATHGSFTEAPASAPFTTAASQTPITAGPTDASPQIAIDDFIKVELRIAQILVAERIPKADKLLRLEVDLGYEKRQILSGIAEHYTPEDLIGRRIIVITNLAPRKMRGLESHGMLLAASEENGKPYLATVPEGVPLGTRLK
jgi:methionyl-tRNA synthetase